MSKTQFTFIILTIILFVIGLWPIAFLTLGAVIGIALLKREEKHKEKNDE